MSEEAEAELVEGYADCGTWGSDGGMRLQAQDLIRRIKADAWGEGNDAGYSDGYSDVEPSRQERNPYRENT